MTELDQLLELLNNCQPSDKEIHDTLNNFCRRAHWFYSSGETRYAVWRDNWEFVLKIPRYDYASEDYCAIECRHYSSAIAYGVQRICLPIELYYTSDSGIAIYKQTRYSFDCRTADCNGYISYLEKRNLPKGRHAVYRKVKAACWQGYRIGDDWLARVIQLYGKKFARSMTTWIAENRINDLHYGNTGYLNNKPIILDYAGYHD